MNKIHIFLTVYAILAVYGFCKSNKPSVLPSGNIRFSSIILIVALMLAAVGCGGGRGSGGDDDENIILLAEYSSNQRHWEKFEYDDNNRITKIEYYDEDELYGFCKLTYNSVGNLISTEYEDGSKYEFTKDGAIITWSAEVTHWDRDYARDIVYKMNYTVELNEQGMIGKYTYDETIGRERKITIILFEYDGKNIIKTTDQNGENAQTFTYDDKKSPFYYCNTPQWYLWYNFFKGATLGIHNNVVDDEHETRTVTFDFEYNDDGFPVSRKEDRHNYVNMATFKYKEPTSPSQHSAAISDAEGAAQADDDVMTMTMTTTAQTVRIGLWGSGTATIDWGDGSQPETVEIGDFTEEFAFSEPFGYRRSYPDRAQRTITIRGNDIIVLRCDNNMLNALDVTRNAALASLYCFDNQLTALDVSRNVEMTHLWCQNNQLTELDLSQNRKIVLLECSNNQLTGAALNDLFATMHDNGLHYGIYIVGNPGATDCDPAIAEAKGWTVEGFTGAQLTDLNLVGRWTSENTYRIWVGENQEERNSTVVISDDFIVSVSFFGGTIVGNMRLIEEVEVDDDVLFNFEITPKDNYLEGEKAPSGHESISFYQKSGLLEFVYYNEGMEDWDILSFRKDD